jgi:hypothetical protein
MMLTDGPTALSSYGPRKPRLEEFKGLRAALDCTYGILAPDSAAGDIISCRGPTDRHNSDRAASDGNRTQRRPPKTQQTDRTSSKADDAGRDPPKSDKPAGDPSYRQPTRGAVAESNNPMRVPPEFPILKVRAKCKIKKWQAQDHDF